MKNLHKYEKYANWLIVGGLIILGASTVLFLFKTTEWNTSSQIDTNIFDHYGSFIGGLLGAFFSLAGVYLLILNLKSQEIDILRQQIENRFFELVKIHRDNCTEIAIQKRKGREVFKWLQREFYKCFEVVKDVNEKQENQLPQKELVNIAYISFYFGAVGNYSSKIVRNYLEYLDEVFLNQLLNEFKIRKVELSENKKFPFKLFDGHQSRLGHYYRHLYQTVKYINEQPNHILDYDKKYEYIKTLRAQLTTQEQVLFFFNSLSLFGKRWELEKGLDENHKLITKYDLIKNIPNGYISYINIKDYYPDVRYEGKENTKRKEKLIENYR